jgi:DNA replication protein DnaC
MESNEPLPSAPDNPTTPPLEHETPTTGECDLERLQAECEARRIAAAADHAPIAEDIAHRRRLEELCQSMRPLTPKQLEVRDAELEARESDREQHRRWSRWKAFIGERGDRYANCRLGNYGTDHPGQADAVATLTEYCRTMPDRIADGEGVILFGPKGTGKDHLLVALARVAIHAGKYLMWQNGMDLFGDIRDAMDKGDSERALVNRLVHPDVLYLSDPLPPFGNLTPHQATMLFRILDARYSRSKPTWVSVNVVSGLELDDRLGAQNGDRLRDNSICILCDWPSYRKARA